MISVKHGGDVTVLDDVRDLVARRKGESTCDDCIANKLKLGVRQHANRKTNILAHEPGFVRKKGTCTTCGGDKLVIHYA